VTAFVATRARCSPCCCATSRSSNPSHTVPDVRFSRSRRWWQATSSRSYSAASSECSPTRQSPTSVISSRAFRAGGVLATTAITFYLVVYFVTTIGVFGVVTVLSSADAEAQEFDEYRGLFARRPWLRAVFTAMLLSLAGIPLTAGFVGKFYLTSPRAAPRCSRSAS
jgi:hypothetical protein